MKLERTLKRLLGQRSLKFLLGTGWEPGEEVKTSNLVLGVLERQHRPVLSFGSTASEHLKPSTWHTFFKRSGRSQDSRVFDSGFGARPQSSSDNLYFNKVQSDVYKRFKRFMF